MGSPQLVDSLPTQPRVMSHLVSMPDPSSRESHYQVAPGDKGSKTKGTALYTPENSVMGSQTLPGARSGAETSVNEDVWKDCATTLDLQSTTEEYSWQSEPTDKGASDSGGGQNSGSGSGKKSGSESSNSSSQQSGSGSRSGGRKHGGSCSGSGSSGEEEDEGNGDKRRHPHQGGGSKDLKPKLIEEDDEATDSADEGVEDATPNSMIMDFSPPQSNQSENGADHASGETSEVSKFTTAMDKEIAGGGGGGVGYSSQPGGETLNRPTSLAPNISINNYEGGKELLSTPATPLDIPQGDSGTVSIESVAPKELSHSVEPPNNAINMIVGYGVPAASAPPQTTSSSSDKSLPGSELGTPTLDSPPPVIAEEKMVQATPATPVPVTPVLSPAISLLPQVWHVCNVM